MPKRINKAIELLEQGQPIYYAGKSERPSYESGRALAKTWADYISLDMEHGSFDMAGLSEFMRGLVDGGPTASGHRTPAVIITIPTDGTDEQVMRANAWMCKQVLARGVARSSAVSRRGPRGGEGLRGGVPLSRPHRRSGPGAGARAGGVAEVKPPPPRSGASP